MPVVRDRLANRRQVSTVSLVWPPFSGSRYHVTIGEYEDGRPGEVWIHGAKVGSEFDGMLDDASILLSVLIQVGFDTENISAALGRV
jgi:ribonucleoside-diphosphate reductase alpha chain